MTVITGPACSQSCPGLGWRELVGQLLRPPGLMIDLVNVANVFAKSNRRVITNISVMTKNGYRLTEINLIREVSAEANSKSQ